MSVDIFAFIVRISVDRMSSGEVLYGDQSATLTLGPPRCLATRVVAHSIANRFVTIAHPCSPPARWRNLNGWGVFHASPLLHCWGILCTPCQRPCPRAPCSVAPLWSHYWINGLWRVASDVCCQGHQWTSPVWWSVWAGGREERRQMLRRQPMLFRFWLTFV